MVLIVVGFTTLDLDVPIKSMPIKNILCNASSFEGGSSCPTSEISTHNSPRGKFSILPFSSLSRPLGFSQEKILFTVLYFSSLPSPLVFIVIFLVSSSPSIHGQTINPFIKLHIPYPSPCSNLWASRKRTPVFKACICILLTPLHTTTSGQSWQRIASLLFAS
jgi:hypothetical protein